ncbi:MAG: CoA-binding protein [Acidimicrobiia bacterium]|nr:CoA-binding protein [Acidimicrobiia bacterium]
MDAALEQTLRDLYASARTIAVVGATPDGSKPGGFIPAYLQSQGYRIVPVTPFHDEVLGERTYANLRDVDVPVDVVDVFRPAAEAPGIVEDAVALGANVVWLQLGIVSDEALAIGEQAGLTVIMDRCMGATHRELGLTAGS